MQPSILRCPAGLAVIRYPAVIGVIRRLYGKRKVSGGYMGKTGGYKEFDLVDLVVAMSVCLCVCPLFMY